MALKPVTLRLDEEEYEKLRTHLSQFGDPDINVAYVLRAYIRDVNRVMPFLINSGWDLKNYFGLVGYWLKQIGSITDVEMFGKMTINPWAFWKPVSPQVEGRFESPSAQSPSEPFEQKSMAGNADNSDSG